MSTNPIRLEWTDDDEREFLREKAQAEFDSYFIEVQTSDGSQMIVAKDYLDSDDCDDNDLDDLNYL